MNVCAHLCICVVNLQRKGNKLLVLCWLIWLLVLSLMTRITFWLFLLWGTDKDPSILLEGPVLSSWATSMSLASVHWHYTPDIPFVLKQESFQGSSGSATFLCEHLHFLSPTLWICVSQHRWWLVWLKKKRGQMSQHPIPTNALWSIFFLLTEFLSLFHPGWRSVVN